MFRNVHQVSYSLTIEVRLFRFENHLDHTVNETELSIIHKYLMIIRVGEMSGASKWCLSLIN